MSSCSGLQAGLGLLRAHQLGRTPLWRAALRYLLQPLITSASSLAAEDPLRMSSGLLTE